MYLIVKFLSLPRLMRERSSARDQCRVTGQPVAPLALESSLPAAQSHPRLTSPSAFKPSLNNLTHSPPEDGQRSLARSFRRFASIDHLHRRLFHDLIAARTFAASDAFTGSRNSRPADLFPPCSTLAPCGHSVITFHRFHHPLSRRNKLGFASRWFQQLTSSLLRFCA